MVGALPETFAAPAALPESDVRLVAALRRGEEHAFSHLLDLYHAPLLRLAMTYVRNRAVAEEIVQDTWLGVIRGIDRFEERSSLKTWIFRILANQAKTRALREGRTVPFSSLESWSHSAEPAVEPERFLDVSHPRWPHHWVTPPANWEGIPESRLLARETLARVQAAIEELPAAQRAVISLRDIEGWTAEEVCELLEISETNQRVLLHRARSKVRRALEQYLDVEGAAA
jgi:RNA polymerase sigma-70 factor (ECF subfamily)